MTDTNTAPAQGAETPKGKSRRGGSPNAKSKTRSHAKKKTAPAAATTPSGPDTGQGAEQPGDAEQFDVAMNGLEAVWNRYAAAPAHRGHIEGVITVRELRAYGYQIQAQNRTRKPKAMAVGQGSR